MVLAVLLSTTLFANAQLTWQNVDSAFGPLPKGVHVYRTNTALAGKPNIAYYIELPLKNKQLSFDALTGNGKRFTPTQYFEQHASPLVVTNCTFFSFANNANLNMVVSHGQLKAYNTPAVKQGKDSTRFFYVTRSAIGISKKRKGDVAWTYTDTALQYAYVWSKPSTGTGSHADPDLQDLISANPSLPKPVKWKMQTAVGGGPVVLEAGEVKVYNKEERMFVTGLQDKHPRTAMGYTADGKLIVLAVEGRNPGIAEGATLEQLGQMLKQMGCIEGLNLDGGGSSCLLINGKPTIKPSDKEGQRPVPAVFVVTTTSL